MKLTEIVAVTLLEGGRWIAIRKFMNSPQYNRAFAVRFNDGAIYDPVVGWRIYHA